jgi:predicted small metal-binding protein
VVCRGKVTAETAEDLIQKVAAHAADAHDVPELSQTLVDYAVTTVRVKGD